MYIKRADRKRRLLGLCGSEPTKQPFCSAWSLSETVFKCSGGLVMRKSRKQNVVADTRGRNLAPGS